MCESRDVTIVAIEGDTCHPTFRLVGDQYGIFEFSFEFKIGYFPAFSTDFKNS